MAFIVPGIAKRVRRGQLALTLTLPLVFAHAAAAQEVDDATRAAARRLGSAGVEAYQAHDYATADEKLGRAFRILQAPSLGLWSARTLEKLGKLVEAQERYVKVTQLAIVGGDTAVQKKAQAEAATDLAALAPRVPVIVVQLEGASRSDVTLTIDGNAVSTELVGEAWPVNPGSHHVLGVRGAERREEDVVIAESERKSTVLRFGSPSTVAPPPASAASAASAQPLPQSAARDSSVGSSQRTIGWATLGVGAAGIAIGSIAGVVALIDRGGLDGCSGTSCPTGAQGKVDSYNTMRTVSSIGFIAGGALAATGIAFLLTAPGATPSSNTALVILPNAAAIRGTF